MWLVIVKKAFTWSNSAFSVTLLNKWKLACTAMVTSPDCKLINVQTMVITGLYESVYKWDLKSFYVCTDLISILNSLFAHSVWVDSF